MQEKTGEVPKRRKSVRARPERTAASQVNENWSMDFMVEPAMVLVAG